MTLMPAANHASALCRQTDNELQLHQSITCSWAGHYNITI